MSKLNETKEFIEEKAKQLYTEVGIQYREILDKINIEDFIRRLLEEARGMGEDWLPTPENINALPEPVRNYIADMQTNADPPSMVADNIIMKDTIKTLEKMLQELPEITEEWSAGKAKKIWQLVKDAQGEDLSDPALNLHYLGLSLDIVDSIISDLRPKK